jgi:hypothetical protein
MKQKPFSLLLLTGMCIFSSVTYAQENNYIVSKYDFIPGEKVIFFDDFTSESVGDFPAQWLTNGSGEIVTSEKFPGRWFHITKMGYYIPEAIEDFTDNFTIEFDFVPMNTINSETMFGLSFYLLTGTLSEPGSGGEPKSMTTEKIPTVQESGAFTDQRDNKTYKTVKIDTQTWMVENLYWWSATTEPGEGNYLNACFRTLGDYYKNEELDYASKSRGSSVRCVKD